MVNSVPFTTELHDPSAFHHRTLYEVIGDPPSLEGALQVTLIDTLVDEFHEKITAMWNNPGDRDTAKAVRQCDRTHRETATNVVNEVLAVQLALLANAVLETIKKGGTGSKNLSDGVLFIFESKVARLEEQITAIEQLMD